MIMNKTTRISEKYILLIRACLDKIENELIRLYWNKNQKEIDSPFANTGESYHNDTFSVSAYSWNDESPNTPNFQYKDLTVFWYKHSNRGVTAYKKTPLTLEFLTEMLNDCYQALEKDFT